jgi:uncharacterized protein YbbK (DUF523 family)
MIPETGEKPRVGISGCLLGDNVRYDGGNKWHRVIVEIVGPQVEWVPFCPEVEIGMGVPREPVNLVGLVDSPSLLAARTGKNWSKEMKTFTRQKIQTLKEYRLNGYIFKNSSPSCGLKQVKVYEDQTLNKWAPLGVGVLAREFLLEFSDLPVADEKELSTEQEALEFIEKIKRHHSRQLDGLDKD